MGEEILIPKISDEDWEKLTVEQQRSYNHKISLKSDYNFAKANYDTSMSLLGPAILGVVGVLLIMVFFLGIPIILIAVIWAFFRVASRSQAYQRFKDTEAALKATLADPWK